MAKKIKDLKNLSFESAYEVDSAFDSDRFIKMKLRIMHSGRNPNFSNFKDESIEDAKPTLCNIPILANVVTDKDGNIDFNAHDIEIEENKMNDGEYKLIYKETPIGIIPETNNYAIEEFEGRKYVTCYGYIWKSYSNYAEDIIESKEECKLSMEILVDDYALLEDDKNYFDIKKYKYTGVTLLGDKYGTGMLKAKAERVEFNIEENKENFIKMAEELKFALDQHCSNCTLEDNKADDLTQDVEVVEPVVETVVEPIIEDTLVVETVEGETLPEITPEIVVEPEVEKFELTSRQILEALNKEISEYSEEDGIYTDSWVMDYDSSYAYVCVYKYNSNEKKSRNYYARCKYTVNNGAYSADKSSFEEVFATWLTASEIEKVDAERNKVVMDLQAERHELLKEVENFKADLATKDTLISELNSFKSQVEMEIKQSEIEEIIAEFELVLKDNDEFAKIKEVAMSMEISDLEKELYALEGKVKHTKVNTGKKDKKFNFSAVAIDDKDVVVSGKKVDTSYYGTATKYIEVK